MRSANVITALLCGMTLLCAQQAPPTYEFYAHFDTSMGEIVVRLFADRNPRTVANFIALAEGTIATLDSDGKMANKPFFNGLEFHRVIRNFMIQTGEVPVVQDCGVPAIADEIDPAQSFAEPGALAMANTGEPNTANCQIFITVAPARFLDRGYTMFGQVVAGQDVANRISETPVDKERPTTPVIIKSLTIEKRGH